MQLLRWCGIMLFVGETLMAASQTSRVYIGTYTGGKSKGIYLSTFDAGSGKLSAPELVAQTKNPTFLCLHPNRKFLYSVGETDSFEGKKTGGLSAYAVDESTGKLTSLNQEASEGAGPCHLALDNTGRCLLVANYGSGSIAALPVEKDGKLGPAKTRIQHSGSSINRSRQEGPHAHFITADPENRVALTCDLGLDKVLVYKLDPEKASLLPNDPPSVSIEPGAGPRHLVFHPNGRWVYVISEMGSSITAFEYDSARGALTEIQMIPSLPADFKEHSSGAEVQIHPSGKFVYASNRGHHSIAAFAVDEKTGKLTLVGHRSTQGKTPRHFAIDPSGKWLLAENQDSDNIVVFAIDTEAGKLKETGQTVEVGKPVCVVFSQ